MEEDLVETLEESSDGGYSTDSKESDSCWKAAAGSFQNHKNVPLKPELRCLPKGSLLRAAASGDVREVKRIFKREYEPLHARYHERLRRFKHRRMQLFAQKDIDSEVVEVARIERQHQFEVESRWREVSVNAFLCISSYRERYA